MALTTDDYEKAFLVQMLGGAAVATDTLQDLRYKFYKGVVEGTIVIGGGGGGSGVNEFMIPRVGDWFTAPDIKSFPNASNQTRASGNGPALGIPVQEAMSVDACQIIVDTAEAASTIRVGIYDDNGSKGYPGTLLGSVSVSGAATGSVTGVFGAPIALTAGRVWAVARVSSLTTLRLRGCIPASHSAVSKNAMAGNDTYWMVTDFGTSAALTADVSGSVFTFDLPDHTALIGLRRSA